MEKISSIKDLNKIKTSVEPRLAIRADKDSKRIAKAREICIRVCHGSGCIASGAEEVTRAFNNIAQEKGLGDRVRVLKTVGTGCHGLCEMGPIVIINPGDTLYTRVKAEDVREIIEKHILKGEFVERLLYHDSSTGKPIPTYGDITFYLNQERRVLHNNGLIDPWSIDEYIARDGYQALIKVLTSMKPDEVIGEVQKAGLRGRGGAGFPTAVKWNFVRSAQSDEKYVVCNGDEGDPGAYMNRSVLEGNPHSVIEGMAIGAYAIGNVCQGYAYVRAEYPLAIKTLKHAIAQAEEYGLLGENILGTGFSFSLDIFPGAGAFVCGEETALLGSIEGKRGNPRQRPPFPANVGGGLFGKPTTINNVETWSVVPQILANGAEWFASIGTEQSKGTKTFSLVGKINNTGLVEVPLGTSVGEMVFDIGGGVPDGKTFKAVQLGGPSGGVIPIGHLNTPIDYESVAALGAIMGSGGVVVMDEDSCMVDVAKFFLEFTRDESCGKCTPCRAGIPEMLEILNRISRGEATLEDLDILEELAEMVSSASLCGLGQTSPNPVLSTIRHFREEYEAHIIDKKCPASVCSGLFRSPCQHTCPVELDIPGYVNLIKEGNFIDSYRLIKQRNPLPVVCGRVCHHPCESKCNRAQVDEPIAIRDLKRFAADYAYNEGFKYTPEIKEKKSEKVAIIGAGPAGLSAAWDLALEGYQVTVFEALPVAGGMLAVAIPEYRLPNDMLKKEIQDIEDLGVEIKLNTPVNDIDKLFTDGYKAVFIATGAHQGTKAGVPGEDLSGVYDGIQFLREINLGRPLEVGKKVAVIGGGNSAIDSARVSVRKGAEEVHVFYRREEKDMPALVEEIEAAKEEGIKFHFLTAPTKILGKNGRVTGIECIRMELGEFDRSGRKTPNPVEGSEYVVDVDMVIEAIGQRPDTAFIKNGAVEIGKGGVVSTNKRTLATSKEGVFAGGDAATGPKTVIEAIAAGQRAACSIRRYLQGQELKPLVERNGYKPITYSSEPPSEEDIKERSRTRAHEIAASERTRSFKEVALTYRPEEARKEASRCLRCDLEVGE
ncbi:MAG: FAD-dependent oxidoreductase [Dehalococcoidales bacterium]|nr:FAD-dependent oxidoreductase [Dehalococcoidales bacterium]